MAATKPVPLTREHLSETEKEVLRRIRSWARFQNGPRARPEPLLKTLGSHPNCAFVAGCQRSGTTMLTRIIAGSDGFRPLSLTRDDELDAALALAGYIKLPEDTRYCFQTTYLDERYQEYGRLLPGQKLVWLVRNPYSVVYSMVYHWRRSALDRLYQNAIGDEPGLQQLRGNSAVWQFHLARVEKACIAYRYKTLQTIKIRDVISPTQLLIVDYDRIVEDKDTAFPAIFEFIGEPFRSSYTQAVKPDSLEKAKRLSPRERELVDLIAMPAYRICQPLTTRIERDQYAPDST